MLLLRQNTAVTVSFGPAVLNTDGVTLVTNLTGTGANQTENTSTGIRLSKNGGAFAARHATAGASTYDAFGNYLVPLDTTDTNTLGTLRMQYANAAAFCPIFQDFMVINTALWDALCAASGGAIPNLVAGAANGLFIAGTNAATAITTALTANVTGNLSGSVGSVTGNIGGNLLGTLTSTERNAIADALLARNIAGGSSAGRIVKDVMAFIRNKWTLVGTTLTVYDTDDTTVLWTATVGTDAAAIPIVSNDPA